MIYLWKSILNPSQTEQQIEKSSFTIWKELWVTNKSGWTSITLFYEITRMIIKDCYFCPRKLGSMQEDLIAVIIIADGYDVNHSENAEAVGGHHFTFTLFK